MSVKTAQLFTSQLVPSRSDAETIPRMNHCLPIFITRPPPSKSLLYRSMIHLSFIHLPESPKKKNSHKLIQFSMLNKFRCFIELERFFFTLARTLTHPSTSAKSSIRSYVHESFMSSQALAVSYDRNINFLGEVSVKFSVFVFTCKYQDLRLKNSVIEFECF